MKYRHFAAVIAAVICMAGFAMQPAKAQTMDHSMMGHSMPMDKGMSKDKGMAMDHGQMGRDRKGGCMDMPCCKGMKKKCPMMGGDKPARSKAMDRTAGSVPVYGQGMKKACANMPCCEGMKKKCPMKRHGEAGMTGMDMSVHAGHKADMAYGGPEAKALDGVMADMHKNMAVPYTGDADADFIRGMIPHHQGAIDMARVVLEYGNDPQAQGLARNIIRAQKGEIAWMKRWLRERQLPETAPIDLRK